MRANAVAALLGWLQGFVRQYDASRRDAGKADFDDLLIWSRDLIRGNAEVRRYFQAKYRSVLVDEFQDTDPLQAELIIRLCAEDPAPDDWTRAVQPGLSSSATRSSRSTASAAPTSRCTTRCAARLAGAAISRTSSVDQSSTGSTAHRRAVRTRAGASAAMALDAPDYGGRRRHGWRCRAVVDGEQGAVADDLRRLRRRSSPR
jgi:hypothetical protein